MTVEVERQTLHSDFYYLLIKINYPNKLYSGKVETLINAAVNRLFGETGSIVSNVKILNFQPPDQTVIVKCDKSCLPSVWASISLINEFESKPCVLNVIKVSQFLMHLSNRDRFSIQTPLSVSSK
ncbi:hypothetical protein DLAC_00035 [Tieghemostelium lacteum]|uniref:Uncharacterized protein n=1 Tax=Tieghemostelium lacteum TaxID=361077 RepID=A0A152A8N3_TIELA|nr:hypothetical protein DLAC_00035 [Tieghemostelium lacteum]|eukprot:KYR02593.1 hypothetical protein DLAC_00035 [Tieghemostelium lacteum]